MKDIESIVNGIAKDIHTDNINTWIKVFKEKIVGQKKVSMSDLEPLKKDDCFNQLETNGFITPEPDHLAGFINPTPGVRQHHKVQFNRPSIAINENMCKLLLEKLEREVLERNGEGWTYKVVEDAIQDVLATKEECSPCEANGEQSK